MMFQIGLSHAMFAEYGLRPVGLRPSLLRKNSKIQSLDLKLETFMADDKR